MSNLYLLFAGSDYYPRGGWQDFKGAFTSLDMAKQVGVIEGRESQYKWWHVVDNQTLEIVYTGEQK